MFKKLKKESEEGGKISLANGLEEIIILKTTWYWHKANIYTNGKI